MFFYDGFAENFWRRSRGALMRPSSQVKIRFWKNFEKKIWKFRFFYQNLAIVWLQNGKQIQQNRSFLIRFERAFKDGFKNVSMSRSGSRNSILCQLWKKSPVEGSWNRPLFWLQKGKKFEQINFFFVYLNKPDDDDFRELSWTLLARLNP